MIFTLPAELRSLWRFNRRRFGNLLFRAAGQSLLELLADPKYLGARPGILMALHTWTQQLTLHPHVHALVTGGGLTKDGHWRETRSKWLLPGRVLMHKFRGKLRALLLRALNRDELRLPPDTSAAQLRGLLNKLGRQTLNVRILEQYAHGQGVATYLARYLRGGPMSNRRLVSVSRGKVTFSYRDRRQPGTDGRGTRQLMTLPASQFLMRYLQHVPPKGFPVVRRYGLYANGLTDQLNQARRACGQPAWSRPERAAWEELLTELDPQMAAGGCCPVCGEVLIYDRVPYRAQAPPPRSASPPKSPLPARVLA